ncbi:hypothetical protein [Alkalibacterium sp.]|nr:MAG: hypothetical protein EA249_01110 [Alkalibacterium sp.]
MKKWMRWQPLIVGTAVFISSVLSPQIESSAFFENWNIYVLAGLVGLTVGTIVGLPYLFFDSYELYKVEC